VKVYLNLGALLTEFRRGT